MQKFQNVIDDMEMILRLIPQRAPMVMVDKLLWADEKTTRSGLSIKEDNLFSEDGHFSEAGLIENIAQTAALQIGYYYYTQNLPAPSGFIGAIKKVNIYHLPKVGEHIETQIEVENEIFGITLVGAEVWQGDTLLADCKMKTVKEVK